jgi:hypothetical protein
VPSDINKPVFHITLFEKQLVRSYLLSDQGYLIQHLLAFFQVNIITSRELESLIFKKLSELGIHSSVSITIFEEYRENLGLRVLSSMLRFGNKSLNTVLVINLQKSLGSGFLRTLIRYSIYFVVSNSSIVKMLLRKLYYLLLNSTNVSECFSPKIIIKQNDVLFITSLCPLRGEDIPIGIFFKKHKIKILGTVRSWDNLLVNGSLLFLPDIFLSHSEYMFETIVHKQGFKRNRVLPFITLSYQDKFFTNKIENINRVTTNINFSYMCQGLVSNPDDENFVSWLINEWSKMPKNFNLYVVQHPSFIMNNFTSNLPSNVRFVVFKYEQTTLLDYYSHLSQMDLVLGGGTTALLDASFLDVPIVAVEFEIVEQHFWRSALRHFDYCPWTADFFNFSKIQRAKNKKELINYILNYQQITKLDKAIVKRFTGDPEINPAKVILTALQSY